MKMQSTFLSTETHATSKSIFDLQDNGLMNMVLGMLQPFEILLPKQEMRFIMIMIMIMINDNCVALIGDGC